MFSKKPNAYIPVSNDSTTYVPPRHPSSSATLLYDAPPSEMIDLQPFRQIPPRTRARGSSFSSKRTLRDAHNQIDAFITLTDARYHIPSPTSTVDSGESASTVRSEGYDPAEDNPAEADPDYRKRDEGGGGGRERGEGREGREGRRLFRKSREMRFKGRDGYEAGEQGDDEEDGEGGYYYGKTGDEEDGEFLISDDTAVSFGL